MHTFDRPRPASHVVGTAAVVSLLDRVLWSGPDRAARAHRAIMALMQRTGCSDLAAADRIAHDAAYTG